MENIVLYSTNCPKCKVIAKKLQMKNLNFTEIDCIADTTYIEVLAGKGFKSMPVLQVGDEYYDFCRESYTGAGKWRGDY